MEHYQINLQFGNHYVILKFANFSTKLVFGYHYAFLVRKNFNYIKIGKKTTSFWKMLMLVTLIILFSNFYSSAIFRNTCIKEASYSSTSRIHCITATIIETLNSNSISNCLPKRLYHKECRSMNFIKTQKYVNW